MFSLFQAPKTAPFSNGWANFPMGADTNEITAGAVMKYRLWRHEILWLHHNMK